jgi:hypothetical protein
MLALDLSLSLVEGDLPPRQLGAMAIDVAALAQGLSLLPHELAALALDLGVHAGDISPLIGKGGLLLSGLGAQPLQLGLLALGLDLLLSGLGALALDVGAQPLDLDLVAIDLAVKIGLIAFDAELALQLGLQTRGFGTQQIDLAFEGGDRRALGVDYLDERAADLLRDRQRLRWCAAILGRFVQAGELGAHLLDGESLVQEIADRAEQCDIL